MPGLDIWITAHPDLADTVFGTPVQDRLQRIRDRLSGHGCTLKLDIGKRSTRATVTKPTLRSKSSYRSLEGFMQFEEARLDAMDEAARVAFAPQDGRS